MISLATHLKDPVVAQMAIAKAVKLCPGHEIQDACILGFEKYIILRVDKSSTRIKVLRTEPLDMFEGGDLPTPGFNAIIALLSNV